MSSSAEVTKTSDFRRAKALLEPFILQQAKSDGPVAAGLDLPSSLMLDDVETRKADLRVLFRDIDWSGMRARAEARIRLSEILAEYNETKESAFEQRWEEQQNEDVGEVAAGAGENHDASATTMAAAASSTTMAPSEHDDDLANNFTQHGSSAPSPRTSSGPPSTENPPPQRKRRIENSSWEEYSRLLPLATYGANMSQKVLALCESFDILRKSLTALLICSDHGAPSSPSSRRRALAFYILESVENPEEALRRRQAAEEAKRRRLEEENANQAARAAIHAEESKLQAQQEQQRKREAAMALEQKRAVEEHAEAIAEAAQFDHDQMIAREQTWLQRLGIAQADTSDTAQSTGIVVQSTNLMSESAGAERKNAASGLLNDAIRQMLRAHSLVTFKEKCFPQMFRIVEALARHPEQHANVLRLENHDFMRDFGTSIAHRQLLFALGFRRIEDAPIVLPDGTTFPKSKGPYYYFPEPDPMEDFEGYASHSENLDTLLTMFQRFQQRIHDVSSAANKDRIALEMFGADFALA
ncbi:unnamed protein product [Amoebophrya sp. A25]|nr:unnamed protein product [Amoebophrya sp. A25]|eukprot:GSA25T00010807001.1